MKLSDPAHSKKLIILAVISGIIAGLVSSVHHWYGAVEYNTPWRISVSYWIMGLTLLVYSLLYVYWKNVGNIAGKVALWLFFFLAVIFQAGFIMFECVYSHVLKNVLFFGGVSQLINVALLIQINRFTSISSAMVRV